MSTGEVTWAEGSVEQHADTVTSLARSAASAVPALVAGHQRLALVSGLTAVNAAVVALAAWLAPEATSATLRGLVAPLAGPRGVVIGRYLVMLGVMLLVELVVLGWRASSLRRLVQRPSRSARSDIVLAGLVVAGYGVGLAALATGGISLIVPDWLRGTWLSGAIPQVDSGIARWILWFMLADLAKYLYHRACHVVQFLWQAHKVHHAATEFTVLTGNRVHPLEHAGLYLTMTLPLLVTGAPPATMFAVYALQRIIDWLQHSPVDWDYGWVGRWVFFSPVGHRIHHSPLPEHWDRNFGDFLVVWDRLLGTWYDGELVNDEVGLSTRQYAEAGPLEQLIDPAVHTYRDLLRSLRSGNWWATHVLEARANR